MEHSVEHLLASNKTLADLLAISRKESTQLKQENHEYLQLVMQLREDKRGLQDAVKKELSK